MSTDFNLIATIKEEKGRKVIKMFTEEDPFCVETFRSHDDVELFCDWIRSKAKEAWGKDHSERDE
jgi:hypothetical protein